MKLSRKELIKRGKCEKYKWNHFKNGVSAATPEELPCMSYSSNHQSVKTGQNNLWTEPKAALYPKQLFVKITRAYFMSNGLKIKDIL